MTEYDLKKNLQGRDQVKRIVDFLFEAGMLRKTPRTGYQFLGTGSENVAEHSFRTAVIGFVLGEMAGANSWKTAMICLFHDLHEARTGDLNYVNKMYNSSRQVDAMRDSLEGTGLTDRVLPLFEELEEASSVEAQLAQDADQIDMIMNLKEQSDLGNKYAVKWLDCALERLRTDVGREIADMVARTDHTDWWFLGPERDWWTRKSGAHCTAASDNPAGEDDTPENG